MRVPAIVLCFASAVVLAQSPDAPAVKKSEQGICHERGSSTYKRTKHFEPYDTMDACLASGGRVAKNAPGEADEKPGGSSHWLGAIGKKALSIVGILVAVGGAYFLSRRRSAGS